VILVTALLRPEITAVEALKAVVFMRGGWPYAAPDGFSLHQCHTP